MSVFLPYQSAWYADPSKVRVCEKSRRIGITWAEAARQVLLASRSKASGGMNCAYVTTSAKLGRIYIRACAEWAEHLGLAAQAMGGEMVDEVLTDEIRFASGFSVRALTSNPEAMRGLGGDVLIDEAAHHADLAELLKAARAMSDWGGGLTVISTHNGADNPFNLLCEEIRAKKRRGSLHRIDIHQAIRDGLYRRRCEVRGEPYSPEAEREWLEEALLSWGAEEEYLCVPSALGATYIRRDLVEQASVPGNVVRISLPPEHVQKSHHERQSLILAWCEGTVAPLLHSLPRDRITTLGVDFARSCNGDLSVIAPMCETRELLKVVPWLIEMRGVPYEEQWQILRFVAERVPRWGGVALDRGLGGDWLAEQALHYWGESRVDRVQISAGWYAENLPRLRSAFEEGKIRIPADSDIRDDFMMIEVSSGLPRLRAQRSTDSKDGKPRHGDSVIAIALALSRHSTYPVEFDFRPVPKPGLGDRRSPQRKYSL